LRLSKYFLPTTRKVPSDAKVPSHILSIRAGLIRQVSRGVYNILPIGYKVIKKIETIIREEMDKIGAQEILMPVIQPAELWQETGRWGEYGFELMRLKDRLGRDMCLGPTHEELITELIRKEVHSYKQLPINLYQIQVKFRDEIRPRFGLLRGREFIMKDAYSFHATWEDLDKTYEDVKKAYSNIIEKCGLDYRIVEAESGIIGGKVNHEFMILAETGEEEIFYCTNCDFAAKKDLAQINRAIKEAKVNVKDEELIEEIKTELENKNELNEIKEVATPGIKTIQELSEFLNLTPRDLVKTVLVYGEKIGFSAFLIRGNRELNINKVNNFLKDEVQLVSEEQVKDKPYIKLGFLGPVVLKDIPIYADYEIEIMKNFVAGANKEGYHLLNVNPKRDFKVKQYNDFTFLQVEDKCSKCGSELIESKGIEVGHIFQLGTKYSESMKAYFLNKEGNQKPFIMGCYGFGVTRLLSAAIEQKHYENQITWPIQISPFKFHMILINPHKEKLKQIAEELYQYLLKNNIEVLYDDREISAGIKFNDADLIGIPMIGVVGNEILKTDKIEIKNKIKNKKDLILKEDLLDYITTESNI